VVVLGILLAGMAMFGLARAAESVDVTVLMPERYFSPDGDGQEDDIAVTYCLSKAANVDVWIAEGSGVRVRTIESGVSHVGGSCNWWEQSSFGWDGKDDAGEVVPDGVYTAHLRARAADAESGDVTIRLGIDSRKPGALTRPSPGTVLSETVDWAFTPTGGFDLAAVSVSCQGTGFATSSSPGADGRFAGTLDLSSCVNGDNLLHSAASWTDPVGQHHSWSASAVAVTVRNPPRLTVVSSERYFSPNGDDQEDTLEVVYCLSQAADVDVWVTNGSGTRVRTIEDGVAQGSSPCSSPRGSFGWDGKDDAGRMVADGVYTAHLTARNSGGSSGGATLRLGVDTRTPGALTLPAAGAVLSGTGDWAFTPTSGFGLDQVSVSCRFGGSFASSSTPGPDGRFTGTLDVSRCANGDNPLHAAASWLDPFGQWHSWSAPAVAVSVRNLPELSLSSSERYFSPNSDQQEDTIDVFYCLSQSAQLDVWVTDGSGVRVRTIESGVEHYGATCSAWFGWDGKDDAGRMVPDGVYTAHLTARNDAGDSGDATIRLGVDTRTAGALTLPTSGAVLSDTADWAFTPTSAFGLDAVSVSCGGGQWTAGSAGPDGRFTGTLDVAGCNDGDNQVVAAASWTDPFGQQHTWTAPAVRVTVRGPLELSLASPERYFSPNGDEQEDTVEVIYCLSQAADVDIWVTDLSGTRLRTIQEGAPHDGHSCSASFRWDGKDDDGEVVADGVYTAHLRAQTTGGSSGDVAIRVGVDTRAPGALTSPAPGDTLAGLARFAFQPGAGFTPDRVDLSFDTGGGAAIHNASPDGLWRTSMYTGSLQNGPATLRASVSYRDPFGASHLVLVAEVPIIIDETALPLTVSAEPAGGAAPLATTFHITTSDPQARSVHYTLNFGDGTTPVTGTVDAPYAVTDVAHTYQSPGAYRAVVTVTNSAGASSTRAVDLSASGAGNTPPTATLELSATSGVVPLPVEATLGGADADDDPLTYSLDFGDGGAPVSGSLPDGPVTQTYDEAGTYLVRLAVSDGKLTTVRTATVVVGLAEPLAANAGDDQAAVVNDPVVLDGTGSRPSAGIESYRWEFGDGATAEGATADHAYATAGTYTATLTVTAGGRSETDTAVITVGQQPVKDGLVVSAHDEGGAPVAGAELVVITGGGIRHSATTDTGGTGALEGLADGAYTIYAWRQGYLPAKATATVRGGSGEATVTLKAGQVATASLSSTPMTLEQVVAAGIDPTDPNNQHVFEFTINLAFEPGTDPIPLHGYTAEDGFPLCPVVDGAEARCGPSGASFSTDSGYHVSMSVNYVHDQPQIVWLVIPGKASWLKEFFSVQMMVSNLADPDFTLDNGSATLAIPDGLTLAPTAVRQSATMTLDPITGGQSRAATWVLRGDTEGFYDLTASYAGTLEPFGDTVTVQAASQRKLHVWGGSAVEMTVDADSDVYDRYPYHVRIGLTNKADVPVYNAAVELLASGKVNYIYQPREALEQGTAAIAPGDTFWTDDYILAPEISGELNLARSFVKKTGGDVEPATRIVSHSPLQTPQTGPQLHLFRLKDAVGLLWDPVEGATSYEIYRTPDRGTDFPATPLAVVPGTANQALLPATTDTSGWYSVSTILNGRNTMVHPIEAVPSTTTGDQPTTTVQLSTNASCGADIGVTARFSDLFYDLTGYTATLDGVPLPGSGGSLSRRSDTVTLKITAAQIGADGSKLEVKATDSSGVTGPSWTGTLSKACNPVRMLVLGDSIAWGQGLNEWEKYPEIVASKIRQRIKGSGRPVHYLQDTSNLAHSGAVVGTPGDADCLPDLRREIPDWGGEVPSGSPDIGACQVAAAKSKAADLILVDGCINDVGPMEIIFGRSDLSSRVDGRCGERFVRMLRQLHDDHPLAVIVVTGYYPIVSIGSVVDLTVLASELGIPAATVATTTLPEMMRRSTEFYEHSNDVLRADLRAVGGGSRPTWLRFVDPGFGALDGVFAPQAKLWGGVLDSVQSSRITACNTASGLDPELNVLACTVASLGHPNVQGAAQYAERIIGELGDKITGWTGTPTIQRLTVTPLSLRLAKGDSQTLSARAEYSDGTTVDAAGLVSWSSNSRGIATVGRITGTVTGVAPGSATVTVTARAGNALPVKIQVQVRGAEPRKITLTPPNPLLAVQDSLRFTATGTMSDGTTSNLTNKAQWRSSSPSIATISSSGVARAVRVGTTTISATQNGITGSAVLAVLSGPPSISRFSPSSGPPGTAVRIRGANLLGATSVTFGGLPATTLRVDSNTQITATVPAGARSGWIRVVTPLGRARSVTRFRVNQ
jgi:PKD repeat protein/flagellar hook assembly protein FlgD